MRLLMAILCGMSLMLIYFTNKEYQYRERTFVTSQTDDGYEVDMHGGTPIVGVTSDPLPDIRTKMLENGKLVVTVLLTPQTRIIRVKIVTQETDFSPTLFSDIRGQRWQWIRGRVALPGRLYWGIITTDGNEVYFADAPFQDGEPHGSWKLVKKDTH